MMTRWVMVSLVVMSTARAAAAQSPTPSLRPTVAIGEQQPSRELDFPFFVNGTPVPDSQRDGLDCGAGLTCVPCWRVAQGRPHLAQCLSTTGSGSGSTGHLSLGHTWAVKTAPSAVPITALLPMFIRLPAGLTAKAVAVTTVVQTGGTATFTVKRNGAAMPGFVGLIASTTASTTTPAAVVLANGDAIMPVVTNVSGAPTDLTVTLFLEYGW